MNDPLTDRAKGSGLCPLCVRYIVEGHSRKVAAMPWEIPPLTLDGYHYGGLRAVRMHPRKWAHEYCYPERFLSSIESYVKAALAYSPWPGGEDVRALVLPTAYEIMCQFRSPTTEEAASYVDFQLGL